MSAILVTGATGNVGALVVAELLARGADVRAAVRTGGRGAVPASLPAGEGEAAAAAATGKAATGAAAAPTVAFDFEAPSTFAGALAGVSRVFLLRPPRMSDATLMRPFIDAMAAAGVEQVVFLSVQGAGTNPFVPHHGIERYLRTSGLGWTLLRPSFFMQNLSTTHLADIRERDEVFVPAGKGRTNFIDVADIAEAAAVVLTEPGHLGRAYELTGTEALTYDEVAARLSHACGRTIEYARPSRKEFAARMKAAGHDDEFVSVMGAIYLIARLGMAAGTTGELERLIGRPPTTFAQFADRNAACFNREGQTS